MKKLVFILIAPLFLVVNHSSAQSLEYGVKVGAASYFGDLSPSSSIFSMGKFGSSAGLFIRKEFNDYLSVQGEASFLALSADDAVGKEEWRSIRNLDFSTNVFEVKASAFLQLFKVRISKHNIIPYGGIGVGVFHFDPYTYYNGNKIFLQPLGTEGQGIEGYGDYYSKVQVNIPLTAGLKVMLASGLTVALEASYRDLFTDHLDDVSGAYVSNSLLQENSGQLAALLSDRSPGMQNSSGDENASFSNRGNPVYEDAFADISIKIGYTITKNPYRGGYNNRRKVSCPTF